MPLCRWQILVFLCLSVVPTGDFESRRKEFEKGILAGNPRLGRERAIKLTSDYRGLEPTKLLVKALNECVREERLLDERFQELTDELADVLQGKADLRLAPPKRQRQHEERKAFGEKRIAEAELLELVVERLSQRRTDESRSFLAGLPNRPRDWRIRTRLIDALGRMQDPRALKELHKALRDKDPRVRLYAADAVGAIGVEDSVFLLAPLLEDKEWQVRSAAMDALKALNSRWCVPQVIPCLGRETGRLRREASELLTALTGQDLGVEALRWTEWWSENGDAFLADDAPDVKTSRAKGQSDPFTYYGIQTYSKKVCFILDISDSMNDDAAETVLPEDGVPKRTGNLRPKIRVARDQLSQAIVDLPEDTTFNIILYNNVVQVWQPKLVRATKRNKNDALAFVLEVKATDATNIYDALEMAFQLAGPNVGDRYYASPVDTIFFLTDGKPTEGRIQDPDRILEELRRMNRVGKITVHTIGVGYLHDQKFLRTLATDHGGRYVNVQ